MHTHEPLLEQEKIKYFFLTKTKIIDLYKTK